MISSLIRWSVPALALAAFAVLLHSAPVSAQDAPATPPATQPTGSLTVTVTDRGIGMDSHEVELAMAHFGQVTGPWIRQHTGTGLGLPLAIGLTELHGGTLTIQSLKGVGTTVTAAFPASRSERTEGATAETTLGGVARQ